MLRLVWIFCLTATLCSCSLFGNMNSNETPDQIARCNELKRQIIFYKSSKEGFYNPEPGWQTAEMDNLNRQYLDYGCK